MAFIFANCALRSPNRWWASGVSSEPRVIELGGAFEACMRSWRRQTKRPSRWQPSGQSRSLAVGFLTISRRSVEASLGVAA